MEIQEDLVVIEFLKLARVMKRQVIIMSNNLDKIKMEDIKTIRSIISMLEDDINRLKVSYGEVLDGVRN